MTRRWSSEDDRISEEALLAGILVGDDLASLTFVRRYQNRLFGIAKAIVGAAALAEDVAQEPFIRVFRHAGVFDTGVDLCRRGRASSRAIWQSTRSDSNEVRQPTPMMRSSSS